MACSDMIVRDSDGVLHNMNPMDFTTDGAFYQSLQNCYTDHMTVGTKSYSPGSVDHIVALLKSAEQHNRHNTSQNRR